MKIVFLIGKLSTGGAERVLTTLANSWIKEHDITIIQLSDIKAFYPLEKTIDIINIPRNPQGSPVSKFFHHVKTIRLISKQMKAIDADVYISFIYDLNVFSILAAKLARKKIIVSEHNNYRALEGNRNKKLRILLYKLSSHVTILTQYDLEYYKKYLSKISVVRNPLSFEPTSTKYEREKIILCVGSLGPQKNFTHIIKAASKIKDQLPGWKVKILGGGKLKTDLQEMIDHLELSDLVELVGIKKDIVSWYRKSSIFVLCSLYEGFPMVLTEAMSQGLPCISYDIISGPNEIITHNKDGLLIPSQNIDALAHAITELTNNREKRIFLGENAVESSKKLTLKNINKVWYNILNDV